MKLTILDDWYYNLKKPSWQPPDWLFGPAWTLIFIGEVTAAVLGWEAIRNPVILALFIISLLVNGILNILWSLFFFKQRRPDIALIESGFLWASVAFPMFILALYAGSCWIFLLPYLLWVSFANMLNRKIVCLNAPFGGV
ncbi:MAG: hypothetical protein B7Z75_08315 [Acidocella sp. 20-57-95]|nr:MAG: hypothetical protein B7Z75_08315 [Acidocella sp. 20-57-95]OYV60548.1 MAG: hypothetical protein B7Z71_06075 [Acidocella sp. 21-58-7]